MNRRNPTPKSPSGNQETRIWISRQTDITEAVLRTKRMAEQLGFEQSPCCMITTAVSELANNIVAYAERGEITVRAITRGHEKGIEVLAKDRGPGIEDVDQALQDRFSSGGPAPRSSPAQRDPRLVA